MATTTKLPPADTGACGTNLGANRHKHRGEECCKPCRLARNARRRELRDEQLARPLPAGRLPLVFGRFVALPVAHPFAPAGDVSQCAACFGWRDDYRHLGVTR
ncbi:hypothetical protein [Micromonospora marina]|uniref:hypothetical protein n=1 Tax=Micromonospora marina TaxID=307120 RepID=UPI00345333FA